MPKMGKCLSYAMGKNYAGDAYRVGDTARCVYCGRLFVVAAEQIAPDGKLQVPEHTYPTRDEIRQWRRDGLVRAR